MWIVKCDAGFKNGDAGISVLIMRGDKEYKPHEITRKAKSPIHSELLSVLEGLREVAKKAGDEKKIIIHNDNPYTIKFCNGEWTPEKPHMVKVMDQIWSIEETVGDVYYSHVTHKHVRRVDRRARRAREKREGRTEEIVKSRIMEIDDRIARCEDIEVFEVEGRFFARSQSDSNRSYEVSLDPPSCECGDWTKKWKGVPKEGQFKYRPPCKHICALAIHLGIDIYVEWGNRSRMFRQ